jgi:menaquinone-dependent protoporphyrinogen oxidase
MKLLVAYETGHGSTAEIAGTIGTAIEQARADVQVDVMRCRDVEDASVYDAYIIGSPVWYGKWLGPARAFAKNNGDLLADHPTAVFFVSAQAAMSEEERAKARDSYLPKILATMPDVEPVSIGNFAGVLDYTKYNLALSLMIKALCAAVGGPTSGTHDFRDMDAIRQWATDTYEAMRQQAG